MKKYIFFLKLFLLSAIFYWIVKSVNIDEAIKVLLRANLSFFIFAFLLNNLSSIFLTIKWHRLAKPLDLKSNFIELLKLNYISFFYSSFVPGQSSGELIKGLKLVKKEGGVQKVWVPIFIDKITNLLIVFLIGFIAVVFDETFRKNSTLVFFITLLTILLSLTTIILFSENTDHFIKYIKDFLINVLKLFKIKTDFIKDFSLSYFKEYKKHDFLMFETLIWSLLTKIPHIFTFYFLAKSLNIDLSIIQSAWLFSIISVVTLIPISFSGLGIREGSMIIMLSQIDVQTTSALSLSLLIFIIGVIVALMGGILELFSGIKLTKNK